MIRKKDEVKLHDDDIEGNILDGFFIEWEIYKNLQIFCNEYGYYEIENVISNKKTFTKDLQFDNYIKLKTKKQEQSWSFYIVSDETKQLFDILIKDVANIVIIYPSASKKQILRLIDKINSKVDKKLPITSYDYNIFKIILPKLPGAPKYRLLSTWEEQEICRIFKCSKNQFNKILHDDPIAIWYNVKLGGLIEITTISEINGRTISYRHVV